MRRVQSYVGPLVLLTALAVVMGCNRGPQLPPTFPVKGKVVKKGGAAWNTDNARITFQLKSDANVVATGLVEKNGDFTLKTQMYGKEKPGAAEGEHTVMVEPGPAPGEMLPQAILPFVVEKTTKIEPKEMNEVRVEVKTFGARPGGGS